MLTLYFSLTSPYARKTRIVVAETGLTDRVTLTAADPWASNPTLVALNPLSKIPTLIADDGTVIFDSPLICEYLDRLHDGPPLLPADGEPRWTALRQQALGDGITDAAVLRRLDTMRPVEQQSATWQSRQAAAIARGLDAIESDTAVLGDVPTIGTIAIGCTLGYLDLRFPDERWREGRPRLADWFTAMAQRPSFVETAPPAA